MKKFIKERNKILFASAIISIVFIIISYALVIKDMGYFRLFFPTVQMGSVSSDAVLLKCNSTLYLAAYLSMYSIISNILLLFMSLFNLVGYACKKNEFHLISIGIGLFTSMILLFYITPIANVLLLLNVLLTILGIIDSMAKEK